MAVVGDWLARRAALSPERVALIDATRERGGGRAWTYRDWNARVNQTAWALRGLGVGKGDRVAVLARNCVEYLDLWFACGKLGAILQALNWRLSGRELAALVEAGAPTVLVYGPEDAALVDALADGPQRVALAPNAARGAPTLATLVSAASDAPPPAAGLDWDDPWVICYTGGTTGLPKGAILTHRSVTWNAINTVASWELDAGDIAILNAPLFHTGGLNVFTAPLVHAGGTSIVCAGFDPAQVLELIRARGVTVMFGVPTMFLDLLARPEIADAGLERLKIVISGGAPCPAPVFERMWSLGARFKTGYGLTEAGPNNFWLPDAQLREKPGAVGYPLMHVDLRIAGEGHDLARALGPGEVGELWLRGPHVFAGYWNNPEATAAALTPDGWLRTGDLARRDEGGCVTIVGRSKDMFISGGENIYPAEIESALAGHPGVEAVAVIGVPHPRWGEVGRAIVVRRAGAAGEGLDEARLLEHARGQLARYKLPRSVVFVEALPRTGAGKIDKRALQARHGD
ncbi:MAG: long-chain fatty acid--CoA ligase [Myxococcales bacterium]|nr:long-chain fatty acid--CoA ligase [Myxococcales bacterium]